MTDIDEAVASIIHRADAPIEVMLVDDSALALEKLGRLVESFGWKIKDTARDGEEALYKFKKIHSEIDLVLMDVHMPRVDGLTCLEEMLAVQKDARIVMVTTDGNLETVRQAVLKGAKHFIVKPFERQKVRDTLMSVVGK